MNSVLFRILAYLISEHEWVPVVPPKKTEEKKSSGLKAIEAPRPTEINATSTSSEVTF